MSYLRLQPDGTVLALAGQWNLAHIADIDAELAAAPIPASAITLDGTRLQTLDTASALALLVRLAKTGATLAGLSAFKPNHSRVLELSRAWMGGDAVLALPRRRGPRERRSCPPHPARRALPRRRKRAGRRAHRAHGGARRCGGPPRR